MEKIPYISSEFNDVFSVGNLRDKALGNIFNAIAETPEAKELFEKSLEIWKTPPAVIGWWTTKMIAVDGETQTVLEYFAANPKGHKPYLANVLGKLQYNVPL